MQKHGFHRFTSAARAVAGFAISVFITVSILSYNQMDYSFSTFSSTRHVSNLAGLPGSFTADVLVQAFGLGSIMIPIFVLLYHRARYVYVLTSSLRTYSFGAFLLISSVSSVITRLKPAISERYLYGGLVGKFTANFPQGIQIALALLGITVILGFSSWMRIILIGVYYVRIKILKHKNLRKINTATRAASPNTANASRILKVLKNKKQLTESTPETGFNQLYVTDTASDGGGYSYNPTQQDAYPTAIDTAFLVKQEESDNPAKLNEAKTTLIKLESVLKEFGIQGKITNMLIGPVVTMYELEPSAGTKSSRVIGLADDIARSMSAISARISVISGRNAIGIELPNSIREVVRLREIIESPQYQTQEMTLPIALGKTLSGEAFVVDLARMPHLLVAGTTGSGKSVAINAMILSLLYKKGPHQCKMIMIDPKMLELSVYDGIPHLLCPVVVDPKKASAALKWIIREMENRYKTMSKVGVRNIEGYNKKIQECITHGQALEKRLQTGFDPDNGQPVFETEKIEMKTFPYIVVIVDEMADLMLVAGKEIEAYIQRLAQMARAAGIHIIMATQRPSVDVITGVIKANLPTRISFAVTSKIDSRTILGEQGAEQLLGMGDMLYMAAGGKITRVHGPFVDDSEVKKIVDFLKKQEKPTYIDDVTEFDEEDDDNEDGESSENNGRSDDSLYAMAKGIVFETEKTSASYIQRRLRIGYNRAANLIERMEKEGILSQPNHSGKRELMKKQ